MYIADIFNNNNGTFQCGFYTSATYNGPLFTPQNAWQHILATWNGTTITTYINGVVVQADVPGGTSTDSGQAYRIGRGFLPSSTAYVRGEIGEVRIYGAALTSGEVTSLYNATASTYTT